MVLSTFPTTLFDFPDHVISYSLTSLLLMFGFTAKENSVKVNKISEVCLHWTGFWGTNVSLHSCLWSFFFFPLSKVSYWCIVGRFGMNRMQKGISGISHYTKKQMEEASLSFGWNIFGLFVLNKLSSRWMLSVGLQATFGELKTPLIYHRETSWRWWFWT